MGTDYENKGALAATIVVAASDSLNVGAANYVCDGVADQVEIQAALDALPVSGGKVVLLDGTYNIEVSLSLNSYQTLKGQGRNTILTTTTIDVDIVTAVGGAGTELTGIVLADLCVDGNAGGVVNDIGVFFSYVDWGIISNVWSINNGENGIYANVCDYLRITSCVARSSGGDGFYMYASFYCSIVGCLAENNTGYGIILRGSTHCSVSGNVSEGNASGIYAWGNDNSITGNVCRNNTGNGIYVQASRVSVVGNTCEASDTINIYIFRSSYCVVAGNCANNATGAGEGITLRGDATGDCDYNTVTGNVCTGNADRGIELIGGAFTEKNIILGNQLLGNGTALADGGLNTVIAHNVTV